MAQRPLDKVYITHTHTHIENRYFMSTTFDIMTALTGIVHTFEAIGRDNVDESDVCTAHIELILPIHNARGK